MPRTALASAITLALVFASGLRGRGYRLCSNEKDDSISVIDLDKMETVETLQVGMRPRGLTSPMTTSCSTSVPAIGHRVGDGSGHPPDHQAAVRRGPRAVRPAPQQQVAVHLQRGRCAGHRGRCRQEEVLAQIDVGVEPEGMAVSPTANGQSTPAKPPTCCTGSTPVPTSWWTTPWSTSALATSSSPRTASCSGPRPRSAERSAWWMWTSAKSSRP